MPIAATRHRQPPGNHSSHAARALTSCAMLAALLVATSLTAPNAGAQSARPPATTLTAQAPATADGPDLQGIWDFTMRVGERSSPGFFALGPVDRGWAGSITMYLTNTLAVRPFAVTGDSLRMVVASREGDVRFLARLTDGGRSMEGIVEYHGGARLPMIATRRSQPAAPR